MAQEYVNGHARPSQAMKDTYKRLQKAKARALEDEVPRDRHTETHNGLFKTSTVRSSRSPRVIFEEFTAAKSEASSEFPEPETCDVPGRLFFLNSLLRF